MPLTLRNLTRVAVLIIGLAIAALLGLVAASRGDSGPGVKVSAPLHCRTGGVWTDPGPILGTPL